MKMKAELIEKKMGKPTLAQNDIKEALILGKGEINV